MPYLVIWTVEAMADLKHIYVFLTEKDNDATIKVLDTIENSTVVLGEFAYASRLAGDLEPAYHELPVPFGSSWYALFYEVLEDTVYILAAKHQKEAGY